MTLSPRAARRLAVKPNSPTRAEHRDEHEDVEHDRRDDGNETDDIHRSRLLRRIASGDRVDDEAEHDEQQHVENRDEVAIEVGAESGDQVANGRDDQHRRRTAA